MLGIDKFMAFGLFYFGGIGFEAFAYVMLPLDVIVSINCINVF